LGLDYFLSGLDYFLSGLDYFLSGLDYFLLGLGYFVLRLDYFLLGLDYGCFIFNINVNGYGLCSESSGVGMLSCLILKQAFNLDIISSLILVLCCADVKLFCKTKDRKYINWLARAHQIQFFASLVGSFFLQQIVLFDAVTM